jgi:hypothetical protein
VPIIRHKKRKFILRWPSEWDIKILVSAIKFRKGDQVDWISAVAKGFLRGLPRYLTNRDLSHRLSILVCMKYNPEGSRRKRAYNRLHPPKKGVGTHKDKTSLFRGDLSDSDRKRFGYKSKSLWTREQQQTLLFLATKYRKGEISINWETLMKDPWIKRLPPNYTLGCLRSYYWTVVSKKNPKVIEQRRKSALEYKRNNYKAYRASQVKNRKIIQNSVNDFLLKKLEAQ